MQYKPEFKEKVLNEVRETKSITSVARKHNMPTSTIATWLKNNSSKIELKSTVKNRDLKLENKNLKNKLADAELELMILKDLLKKSYNP